MSRGGEASEHTAWPWIALALHVYGLLAILGLHASMVTRPHLMTSLSSGVGQGQPAILWRGVRPE